jgi:hypothetical protein
LVTVTVVIDTVLRGSGGTFGRFAEVESFDGDLDRIEGAVVMHVDGAPILTHDEWDDLDPLWAYLVQAVEQAEAAGAGETLFPDQPILFRAEVLATGRLLGPVTIGQTRRAAAANAAEFYRAVGAAGFAFFQHRDQIIRRGGGHQREADQCARWLRTAAH